MSVAGHGRGYAHPDRLKLAYQCEHCNEWFRKEWSDHGQTTLYADPKLGGSRTMSDAAIVCDDCYHTIIEWWLTSQQFWLSADD